MQVQPWSILWQPNHGLTDSTSWSFWAKPIHDITYHQILIDSVGCAIKDPSPLYCVSVSPVGIEKMMASTRIKLFPNPADNKIHITFYEQSKPLAFGNIRCNTNSTYKLDQSPCPFSLILRHKKITVHL